MSHFLYLGAPRSPLIYLFFILVNFCFICSRLWLFVLCSPNKLIFSCLLYLQNMAICYFLYKSLKIVSGLFLLFNIYFQLAGFIKFIHFCYVIFRYSVNVVTVISRSSFRSSRKRSVSRGRRLRSNKGRSSAERRSINRGSNGRRGYRC